MAELKNRPNPGPFNIEVTFVDGSKLTVLNKVDGSAALQKYTEYVSGIGARVGTTRQVRVFELYDDGSDYTVQTWTFKGSGAFS